MTPKQKFTDIYKSASTGLAMNPTFGGSTTNSAPSFTKTPAPTVNSTNQTAGNIVPSSPGATGTTPGSNSPMAQSTLPPAGIDYAKSLAGGSQPSPTPSFAETPKKEESAYLTYLRSQFNPEEAKLKAQAAQAAEQRLADIQSQRERAAFDARKGTEAILDKPGGLKSGAQQAASVYERRSSDDLADLALQESAAARSAGVAYDAYNSAIKAGASIYEAEEIMRKEAAKEKEAYTLGKDQVRYQFDPATGQYKAVGGVSTDDTTTSTYERGVNPIVDSYIQGVRNGTYKPSDIPEEYRGAVAQGLAQTEKTMASAGARETLTLVDELLTNPALAGVTGPIQQYRPDVLTGGEGILAKNKIDSLIANLKLDAREKLKGSGAISDFEFKVLGQAATAINKNLEFTELIQELQKLKNKLSGNAPIPATPINGDLWKAPDGAGYEFINGGWEQISEPFSSVGNTTVSIPKTSRLAYVNNNPGNLRFAGQSGASQGEGGFARFSSPEAGVQALQRQIELDASRGLTLAQFINKYAPPTENDTQSYIKDMVALTGATPLTPLSAIDIGALTRAVAKKESSTNIV